MNFLLILSFKSFFSLTSGIIVVSDAERFFDDFMIDFVVKSTLSPIVSLRVFVVATTAVVIVVLVSKKAIIFF